jgi:hypothetical protein
MGQKRFIATKLKKKAFVSKRLLNFLVKKLISEQQELQQLEQAECPLAKCPLAKYLLQLLLC